MSVVILQHNIAVDSRPDGEQYVVLNNRTWRLDGSNQLHRDVVSNAAIEQLLPGQSYLTCDCGAYRVYPTTLL